MNCALLVIPLLLCGTPTFAQETQFFRMHIGSSSGDVRISADRDSNHEIRWAVVSYRGDLASELKTGTELYLRRKGGPLQDETELVLPLQQLAATAFSGQIKLLPDDSTGLRTADRLVKSPDSFEAAFASLDDDARSTGAIERARRSVLLARLGTAGSAYLAVSSTGTEVTSARITIGLHFRPSALPDMGEIRITRLGADSSRNAVWTVPMPSDLRPLPLPDGSVSLATAFEVEITPDTVQQIALLQSNPVEFSIDLVPVDPRQPAISGTLLFPESSRFSTTLTPLSAETYPTGSGSVGTAAITALSLRASNGSPEVNIIQFDVLYHFRAPAQVSSLELRAILTSTLSRSSLGAQSSDGYGSLFGIDFPEGTESVRAMFAQPENVVAELHAEVQGQTGLTGRLSLPAGANPAIRTAGSLASPIPALAAPGAVLAITGSDLARTASFLEHWQWRSWPTELNAVKVLVDGTSVPILAVSTELIMAQLPLGLQTGDHSVSVLRGGDASTPVPLTVAAHVPAVLNDSGYALAFRMPDWQVVSSTAPVIAGDTVRLYATGLGQTNPGLTTGTIPDSNLAYTTCPTTVLVGTVAHPATLAVASSDFLGLYVIEFQVGNVGTGQLDVRVRCAGAESPSVKLHFAK